MPASLRVKQPWFVYTVATLVNPGKNLGVSPSFPPSFPYLPPLPFLPPFPSIAFEVPPLKSS